jgi:hypothetical protein
VGKRRETNAWDEEDYENDTESGPKKSKSGRKANIRGERQPGVGYNDRIIEGGAQYKDDERNRHGTRD